MTVNLREAGDGANRSSFRATGGPKEVDPEIFVY